MKSKAEIESRARFEKVRYAQCWEDADVLLAGLDPAPGATLISIASAGDNSLALLAKDPKKVVALDLNPAQIHCARLKTEAIRHLNDPQLNQLHAPQKGGEDPLALYRLVRPALPEDTQAFWDEPGNKLAEGLGAAGKFERYFALFRRWVLPFAHSRRRVDRLLQRRSPEARKTFYQQEWNTWRWRALFHLFFSRTVMGRLGRDPAFFRYVEGSVAERILERTRYALTELAPEANPYLHWILKGHHGEAKPFWLRPENLTLIRKRLDRVEWRLASLEEILGEWPEKAFDGAHLSDIFEYMSEEAGASLLTQLADKMRPGGRLVYWNMLAPRQRPESLAERIHPLEDLARDGFARDQAFFYRALRIEEVRQ